MTYDLTDCFCGGGGSSTGGIAVPGVTVRCAANHWPTAVETHQINHPGADHICADLSQIHPRYFPRTRLGWFSPECTNHSRAKGKKKDTMQGELWGESIADEAAERSRATMWDVVRFTEHHQYDVVFVENVVEVADWLPYRAWLLAMESVGYRHQVVCLNSMHAQAYGLPAPQSRDRIYIVFTRNGVPRPDFERMQRPKAYCPTCDEVVDAMQAWKRPDGNRIGRYRQQYVYRCPHVNCRNQIVEPGWLPAASIIDWSMPGQRIGDRKRPLADKTRARIAAGIARYWGDPFMVERRFDYRTRPMTDALSTITATETTKALAVPVEGRADVNRARTLNDPLRTQNTRLETGLAYPPFVAELRGGGSTARPVADPLATVTASGNHHALITSYYGNGTAQPVTEPVGTVTTVDRHALIMRNYGVEGGNAARHTTPASEPIRTIVASGQQSVLTADDIAAAAKHVDDVMFRMLEPSECKRAMAFPADYVLLGNRREQVRMAGNAVTPPAARDLIGAAVAALEGSAA